MPSENEPSGSAAPGGVGQGAAAPGFAAWAGDHAKASTIRAWSAWNAFFRARASPRPTAGSPTTMRITLLW